VINPGSVGLPLSSALAALLPNSSEYALAVVDDDALEAFRRLPTDVEGAAGGERSATTSDVGQRPRAADQPVERHGRMSPRASIVVAVGEA
jgi:hypothetical protein